MNTSGGKLQKTILIVEDEAIIGMEEAQSLKYEGYNVINVMNGEKAIEVVNREKEKIDLILMDIDLGQGMDGTYAAQEILKNYNIPVVFLSSHTEKDFVERMENITSYGYIVKNAGITVLDASIKMAFKLYEAYTNIQVKNKEIEAANEKLSKTNEELLTANEEMFAANEELIRSENEIIKTNHLYAVISQINQMIVRSHDRNMVFAEACRIAVEYGNFRMAWIALPDDDGEKLIPLAWNGFEEGFLGEIENISLSDLLIQREPAGSAILEGKVFFCNDIEKEAVSDLWSEEALKRGYRSSIGLPLFSGGKTIGAYCIYASEPQSFNEEEIKLFKEITNDISFALGSFEKEVKREKVEEALRINEERFRNLFENAKDSILIIDQWTMAVLDANPAALLLYGYSREELLSMKVTGISAEPEMTSSTIRDKITNIPFRYHRNKEGTVFPVEITVGYFEMEGRTLITAFIRDITEKKQTEYEREITIRSLQLIYSSSNLHELIRDITCLLTEWSKCEAVGIRLKDGDDFPYFETQGFPASFVELEKYLCNYDKNGNIIRDNNFDPVLDCMCGNVLQNRFNPALPFFTKFGSFWTNSTTKLLASTTEKERQSRTRNRCNGEGYESVALIPLKIGDETLGLLQLNSKDKNKFTIEKINMFEQLAGNLALGLAQRQSDTAMRKSEERYRSLFENMLEGFAYCRMYFDGNRPDDFIYINVNKSFESLTGLKNVAGKRVSEVIPGIRESDPELFEIYGRVAATGKSEKSEMLIKALNTWFSISVYSPEKEHFVVVFDVINERKKIEEELVKSLKEKDILFKELQHRVKNNLNVIYSLLSFEQRKLTDEYSKQVLINTKARIRAMSGIYEKLYQSASIDMLNLNLYVKDFIKSLYEMYVIDTGKINFTLRIGEIKLDMKRTVPFVLILNELISNALKYAFQGRERGEIFIDLDKSDDKIVLTVSDNGIGLPEDLNPDTAESMGFMLVRMLTEQIKGILITEVPAGGGASFILSFKL